MLKRKKEHLDCENSHYFAQNLLMHTGSCSNGLIPIEKKLFCQRSRRLNSGKNASFKKKKKSDSFDILGMDRVCL